MTADGKQENQKIERKKRQKYYLVLATARQSDSTVEDGGRLLAIVLARDHVLLVQWGAGHEVEAQGAGTRVTIAQEHLLDLKQYHKTE